MATPKTRNPKFDWSKHDIQILKKEYYQIWLTDFCKKYQTGRWSVFLRLGYLPDEVKKAITDRKFASKPRRIMKSKIDRFENTTKVARMYEKKMNELQVPKYTWPWSAYMKF